MVMFKFIHVKSLYSPTEVFFLLWNFYFIYISAFDCVHKKGPPSYSIYSGNVPYLHLQVLVLRNYDLILWNKVVQYSKHGWPLFTFSDLFLLFLKNKIKLIAKDRVIVLRVFSKDNFKHQKYLHEVIFYKLLLHCRDALGPLVLS